MRHTEYNHITDHISYVKHLVIEQQNFIAQQNAKLPINFKLEELMKKGKETRLKLYQQYEQGLRNKG